jgi:hypothetical protein
MAAPGVEVAQGVRDALNGAGSGVFSQDFTAAFDYRPTKNFPDVIDSTDADDWLVLVTLGNPNHFRSARNRWGETYPVHVGLLVDCRKPSPETGLDEAKIGEALVLLDEIYRYLRDRMIDADSGKYGPLEVTHDPVYDPEDLDSGLFAGVLILNYRTER